MFPHVGADRCVGPGMLDVQPSLCIGKDHNIEGLVKPTVGSAAMEERATHASPVIAWVFVVKREDKESLLDLAQRLLVQAHRKEFLSRVGPSGAVLSGEGSNGGLSGGGAVFVGITDDPLELTLKDEGSGYNMFFSAGR